MSDLLVLLLLAVGFLALALYGAYRAQRDRYRKVAVPGEEKDDFGR